MSEFQKLYQSPPKLTVNKNVKEVIIETISCMCDNRHLLKLRKNTNDEFRLTGGMSALSNWQFKHDIYEIEWAADEENWSEVFRMINTGTAQIKSVKSR